MERIFTGNSIEIFKQNGRHYMSFDAGGVAIEMKTIEITAEEAAKAQKSEKDADEVIFAWRARKSS